MGTDLLTIGAFAKASRLSPKALRLYDRLGLVTPARVDPFSGYRLYAPAQLERARLVAWLRRLGMPLARIQRVCELAESDRGAGAPGSSARPGASAGAAAREVRAYWAAVEAETTARRDLATFLIDHLSGKEGPEMTEQNETTENIRWHAHDPSSPTPRAPLGIRYAALTDAGRVRGNNQDTAYAGERLLAVADGFGAGGGTASAAAVDVFKRLETDAGWLATDVESPAAGAGLPASCAEPSVSGSVAASSGSVAVSAGELLNVLGDAVREAARAVHGAAASGDASHESGTTLTAALWTGSRLALVHIGDSRAYLLRDGGLFQITHDHTVVQTMIDEGRLSPEEAASHPQRALLARALTGGSGETAVCAGSDTEAVRTASAPVSGANSSPSAQLRLHDVRLGDRYLLCSDGLSAVVPTARVRQTLSVATDPDDAVRTLVGLANEAGGPDNVSCVVADVVEAADG
ncbi:MerR family transcriptional regulator [Streptomyces tubbatahanensis]|uniref:MerR family transcriptional regulator n=1 Tax=Streptomyces tubbatahanensis TaxID=2923272 RepID=A0ABY3XTJ9_9ACTN|nr:MerR family transcriptional regulator [Streptomyces tubbatahanensis]UNS97727.1 MerR family transcriptional regulator [Streptomyces tubbatahanensis]